MSSHARVVELTRKDLAVPEVGRVQQTIKEKNVNERVRASPLDLMIARQNMLRGLRASVNVRERVTPDMKASQQQGLIAVKKMKLTDPAENQTAVKNNAGEHLYQKRAASLLKERVRTQSGKEASRRLRHILRNIPLKRQEAVEN